MNHITEFFYKDTEIDFIKEEIENLLHDGGFVSINMKNQKEYNRVNCLKLIINHDSYKK